MIVTLNEIIELLVRVQITWMYLESIFSSPDIQRQMPDESQKFNAVDKVKIYYELFNLKYK